MTPKTTALAELLEESGFTKSASGHDVVWKLSSKNNAAPVRAKIEILERKSQFHISKCNIQIDWEKLSEGIRTALKSRHPRILSWMSFTDPEGRLRTLAEIGPMPGNASSQRAPDSLRLPGTGTTIGWTTSITHSAGMISVQFTDAFLIGDHLPTWWSDLQISVAEAITPYHSKSWDTRHLQELTVPLAALPVISSGVKPRRAKLSLHDWASISIPTQLKTTRSQDKTTIETTHAASILSCETPIEILEARATSNVWQAIDSKIVQRKSVKNLPTGSANEADTLARLAAANDCDASRQTGPLDAYLRRQKSSSLLTITGAIRAANATSRDEDKIHLVSELLRKIGKTYGSIDSLAPLQRIVPEVLGDSWATINPEMAFRSWEAAVDRPETNLRLYRKISLLARKTGDQIREFEALMTLAKQERRRPEMEKVAGRIAEIISQDGKLATARRAEVIAALERAMSIAPDNSNIISAMAEQLTEDGQHRQAIAILESFISTHERGISGKDLSQLQIALARLWRYHEENQTIASLRYSQATTPPAEPAEETLAEAEAFFDEIGRDDELQRLIRMRANGDDALASLKATERSARYFNDRGKNREALVDIQKLIKHGRIQQWYLDVIEASPDLSQTELESLCEMMLAADTMQLPRDARARWILFAAKNGIKSLKTRDIATDALIAPAMIPLLEPSDVSVVISNLIHLRKTKELEALVQKRLPFASEAETLALLEVINEKGLSSDDGLFENALAETAAKNGDHRLSLERGDLLIQQNRVTELRTLHKAHDSSLAGRSQLSDFEDQLITRICKSGKQDFAPILEDLLESRLNPDAAEPSARSRWIKLIIQSGYLDLGARYLEAEVGRGQLCIEDEIIVSSLLGKRIEALARWHWLSRSAADTSARQLHHATQCYDLWMATHERPSELISVIIDFSKSRILTTDHLEIMEHLCAREGRIMDFITTLSSEIERGGESERTPLAHWGIRVITSRLDDPELAAKKYLEWLSDKRDLNLEELFTLGMLFFQGQSLTEAQTYLIRFLNSPESIQNRDVLLPALDALARCRLDRAHFATISQTLISWARARNDEPLTESLRQRAIEWQVAGIEDLNQLFQDQFTSGSLEQLAAVAVQIISKNERLGVPPSKTIASWQESQLIQRHPERWRELLSTMTKDRFLGNLRRAGRCDVLYSHARILFDDDLKHFDAIPHFENLALENPMDTRTWIPLYSLYEESGARQKLIAHLERVIPLIQKDKALLERTPFNLESLKNSLKRARSSMSGLGMENYLRAKPEGRNDFDLEDRAAQMQKAWIAAAPPLQISLDAAAQAIPSESAPAPGNIISLELGDSAAPSFDGSSALNLSLSQELAPSTYFQENTAASSLGGSAELTATTMMTISPGAENQQIETDRNQLTDWRDLIGNESVAPGTTERIMTMAFASEVEKHVAVQCVALLNGESRALEAWHWPVWRNPDTCDYSLSPKGRLPELGNLRLYGGELHKLLRMLYPIIVRQNQSKFVISGKLTAMGLPRNLESTEIGFDHPSVSRGTLKYFTSLIRESKIRLMDTPGMGAEVFFDLRTNAIHFDARWQVNLPPTILTHRILDLVSNYRRGQIGLIDLNPVTEIIPAILQVSEILTSSGMARLRIAFGIEHRDISEQLKSINREQLVSLMGVVGRPSIKDITQLQHEMRIKTLATMMATTLDVIGIMESLTGRDLCDPAALTPKAILNMHPYAKELLKLAVMLPL